MVSDMNNPFVYSSTVEGESFCNRKQELRELTEFCLNGPKRPHICSQALRQDITDKGPQQ